MKFMKKIAIVLLVAIFFTSCNTKHKDEILGSGSETGESPTDEPKEEIEPIKGSDFILDTLVTITLYDSDDKDIIIEAFDLCREYENILSAHIDNSDIGRINNANGDEVEVSKKTIEVLERAIYFSEISEGKFDVSIGAVSLLWDFKDDGILPDDADIKENIKTVNYENIQIDGNKVKLLDSKMKLDLGAIAKGYIGDKLKEFLLSKGIKSGIINLGGNVVVVGSKYPEGGTFAIGIRQPFEEKEEVIGKVDVIDSAIVSSGVYERFFYKDGEFYHHILNTQTGYPVENNLSAITIISESSTDADAISTLSFILGIEDSIEFINNLDHVEAILIDSDNKLYFTNGINDTIPFLHADNF